jgi:hypothetical protein
MTKTKIQVLRTMASFLGMRQAIWLYTARLLRLKTVYLRLKGVRSPVLCRPTDSDRHSLCHVFLERDCDVDLPFTPEFIIDGGIIALLIGMYMLFKAVYGFQTNG